MRTAVVVLQLSGWTETALLGILGFGLLAGVAAVVAAFAVRSASTRSLPTGVAVLLGLSIVAVPLSITAVTSSTVIAGTETIHHATGAYLLGVFLAGAVGAEAGRRVGDHVACSVYDVVPIGASGEAATLLRSAALVRAVELPSELSDLDGYATVDEPTKRRLAGRTMTFPNRLSNAELESRIRSRLARDFDVDAVHLDLDADRRITSLAVGRQPSGVGPLLPPGTVAVAVDGDPAPDASAGDPVELWSTGHDDLVATGTVRASTGDATTVAVRTDEADGITPGGTYRLLTRSGAGSDVHALVATLWDADATVTSETVEDGGPLHGEFADWLPVWVLVVERDGERLPFPADNETLEPGDTVHVLGSPGQLHRLANYEPRREPIDRSADAAEGDDGEEGNGPTDGAESEADSGGLLAKISGD